MKTKINKKYIEWSVLLTDILEAQILTQAKFAKKVNVTQQSISNIINTNRLPSQKTAQRIEREAIKTGLKMEDYEKTSKIKNKIKKKDLYKKYPIKIRRLCRHIETLKPALKGKVLKELNLMIDHQRST